MSDEGSEPGSVVHEQPLLLDVSVQSSRFHSVAGAALHLSGICIAVGGGASERRDILRDASLSVRPGSRIALIGRNGSGKSVFLKVLASGALLDPDAQLLLRAQLVSQSFAPPSSRSWTVADEVAVPPFGCNLSAALAETSRTARRSDLRSGRRGRAARVAAVAAAACAGAGSEPAAAEDPAVEAPSTAETLAAFKAVGVPMSMLEQPWESLSGGWRMRVVLAKAVLYSPSLLLLDEVPAPSLFRPLAPRCCSEARPAQSQPTNHLDIRGINQIIALLSSDSFAETTIIFVSHDLHFVNSLASACLQLQEGKLTLTSGNWDTLQRERAERKTFTDRYAAEQQRGRARLLSSIEESLRSTADDKARKQLASRRDKALEREDGLMRNSKGHRFKRNAAENAGHHATLLNAVQLVPEERPVRFRFEPPDLGRRGGSSLLSVDSLAFSYPTCEGFDVRLPDLTLSAGERIVLLGPNGHGKSTLLKLLAGQLPSKGAVRMASPSVGYFEQHAVSRLGGERHSALEHVAEARRRLGGDDAGGREAQALLGRFGLGPHADTPVAQLSGGQRVALELVVIAMSEPSLLLLDEPSAHLDIPARRALADALAGFAGAVMFVSHDIGFIELVRPTCALVCIGGRFRTVEAEDWKQAALDL